MAPTYSDDEAREILRIALEREGSSPDGLTHEELVAAAGEVGIPGEQVALAAEALREQRSLSGRMEQIRRRKRRDYGRSALRNAVVVAFLFVVNWLTAGGLWAHWPALAVLFFTVMRAPAALFPTEERVEQLARRELDKEAAWQRKQARKRDAQRVQRQLEGVVEQGVRELVAAIASIVEPRRAPGASPTGVRLEPSQAPPAGSRVQASPSAASQEEQGILDGDGDELGERGSEGGRRSA